jgi:hypothetical protein
MTLAQIRLSYEPQKLRTTEIENKSRAITLKKLKHFYGYTTGERKNKHTRANLNASNPYSGGTKSVSAINIDVIKIQFGIILVTNYNK